MCGTPHRSRRTSTALSRPVRRTRPSRVARRRRAESRSALLERCAKTPLGGDVTRRSLCAGIATRATAVAANAASGTRGILTPTNLSNAIADATPADVGEAGQRPVARVGVALLRIAAARPGAEGVVDDERLPADVVLRNESPVATVLRAIAIVAHHEVTRAGDEQRSPVIVRGYFGRRAESRVLQL